MHNMSYRIQGRSDGGISVYIGLPSQNQSLKIIFCTNIAADVVRLLIIYIRLYVVLCMQ